MAKIEPQLYLWGSVKETLKSYALSAVLAFGILVIASNLVNYNLFYYISGFLFLITILVPAVAKWIPKERISPEGKAVFISGCDTGFGHMLAQRLDDIGFHVFAGCLFPEGEDATNLQKSGSSRLHVVGLDVTSDTSVKEAVDYVNEHLKDNVLWAVVNNAGISGGGELIWNDMDTIQKVIEVNTLGTVRLSKAFLSKLKESKGRILTVASMGGRISVPGLVPYCMSKAAAISFSDGLRLEMYRFGIQVIVIEPGFYKTPLISEEHINQAASHLLKNVSEEVKDMYSSMYLEKSVRKVKLFLDLLARNPVEVVEVMEEGLTALYPEYYYAPGFLCAFLLRIAQMFPKPISDMFIFYILVGNDLQ